MRSDVLLKTGPVLLGWALLCGGGASADALPPFCAGPAGGDAVASGPLRYPISLQQTAEVLVASEAGARMLIVRHRLMPAGTVLAESAGHGLLPVPGSAGETLERVCLLAEADGFTLFAAYRLAARTERYWLGFTQQACDPARPAGCVIRLARYRHERLDADARVRSGLVADYRSGQARWLGEVADGPGVPALPARLRSGPGPGLTALGSLFDFAPALDLPRSR